MVVTIFRIFISALFALLLSACVPNRDKSSQNPPNLSSNPPHLNSKPNLTQISPSIPQKLADSPKDSIIKVLDENGQIRCYMPDVRSVYVVIGTCRTSWAKPTRYDVFGRIAYNIEDTWLCLTAPESVVQTKRKDKDYLTLKPCAINDKKQRWKLKDDLFYGLDESYVIKDDGAYLYAANMRDTSLKLSKIHASMSEWLSTIARPANLSILTSLAWDYTTSEGRERYFLYNNGSGRNTTDLYYNLESGHIAQYDGYKGLNCLYADLGGAQWSWAWWGKCTDAKAPSKNRAYWRFIRVSEAESVLLNFQGAALRVTSTGIYWGTPYIVAPKYLLKDNSNSPTSRFIIDKDTQDWLRFIYANIGDNLPSCPAPAQNLQSQNLLANSQNPNLHNPNPQNLAQSLQNQVPPLPYDFSLNDAWRARLLAIINTNDGSPTSSGVCGVCLLQSFQIIAELLENPRVPRVSGGYFYDTQAGTNPFVSFQARNSLLYQTLDDIVSWFPNYAQSPNISPNEAFIYNNNLALMSAIALLPQHNWRITTRAQNPSDIPRVINTIFNSQRGSAFVLLLRLNFAGGEGGHAMVALQTTQGVVLVPTNAAMSAEEFNGFSAPIRNMSEFMQRFSAYNFGIANIALLEVSGTFTSAFIENISLNNCTGFGDGRRGNSALPTSAFVNQCASGRCLE